MTKILFGGSAADFTVDTAEVDSTANVLLLAPAASLIAFDAGAAGSQILDLNVFTGDYVIPGTAVGTDGVFTAEADGTFSVWAEDTLNYLFVADPANPGRRWIVHPVNVQARLRALEDGADVNVVAAVNALKGVAGGIAGLTDPGAVVDITDLPVGDTASHVAAGNRVWGLANMPPGYRHTQTWDGVGTTPNRDTARTDVRVIWESPNPPSIAPGKAIDGDRWENTNP